MHPFWIATHDPHGPDDRWYVYLKRRTRAGGVPHLGHEVLFYETANVGPNGQRGRKALVFAGLVVGDVRDRVPPKGDWQYEVPCGEPEKATTEVGRDDMLTTLGLKLTTPIFTWRGLRNISEAEYLKLRRMMGLP